MTKLIIETQFGLGNMPHHWNIVTDDGMYVLQPHQLVKEAQERQVDIIQEMVRLYNEAQG